MSADASSDGSVYYLNKCYRGLNPIGNSGATCTRGNFTSLLGVCSHLLVN